MSDLESLRQGHGGFIALLAGAAMGRARIGEPLDAVGRVLHSGRRTGVAECRVAAPDGRLVATATATFAVAPPVPSESET